MKLLTATSQAQGQRASDFNWCIDGELVTHATLICDSDRAEGPDGGCGCGRSFTGLNSHKGTTTAIVRHIDGYTLDDLAAAVASYREQAGWTQPGENEDKKALLAAAAAAAIAELAAQHPAGTILERRLEVVQARSEP